MPQQESVRTVTVPLVLLLEVLTQARWDSMRVEAARKAFGETEGAYKADLERINTLIKAALE